MKQKGFAQIVVIILLLVLVGGTAYYFGTKKGSVLPVPIQMPVSSTIATPNPAVTTARPTANPTANWKTYTNEKYGFSFKYPNYFGDQGAIAGPFTGTSVEIQSFSDPATIHEGTDAPFDGFSVYIVTSLNSTNFNEYINSELRAMNTAEFASMKNATRSQLTNMVVLTSESGSQAYYYLPTTDQKQIVVFAYLQANVAFKQTFDQIMSTFKFTK